MSGLDLQDISHAFGTNQVLHGVSLSVEAGELVCLLGPSGCGKTTLLRIAAGLESIQQGRVRIGENVVADASNRQMLPPEARGVGLMFQDFALFPHLRVKDNIAFGIRSSKKSSRGQWISDSLANMGLGERAQDYPHTLSGGQQQRVALLRALAPEPNVLLLDEPFSGLDVTRRRQIRTETLSVIKETGVATLMVTHDPEEAMFMADRILVMDAGRVVQDGAPADLYFNPIDPFVTELFGPVNRFSGQVESGLVATPVGTFTAPEGLTSGPVNVLIRPEAFVFFDEGKAPDGDVAMLTVTTARPLGRSSVIFATASDGTRIEGRTSGILLPDTGTKLCVQVDPRLVHIFP